MSISEALISFLQKGHEGERVSIDLRQSRQIVCEQGTGYMASLGHRHSFGNKFCTRKRFLLLPLIFI
jgi:hypothetical protein